MSMIVIFKISTLEFISLQKQKLIILGPKMPYVSIFRRECWETIVIFEVSILEFVKSKFLADTVNFEIGSTFSKSPGSTVPQGLGPGPGLLYKVCHLISNWAVLAANWP